MTTLITPAKETTKYYAVCKMAHRNFICINLGFSNTILKTTKQAQKGADSEVFGCHMTILLCLLRESLFNSLQGKRGTSLDFDF